MSPDEYRYEWDLPTTTRLASVEVRNTAGANAMQRVDQAGPQEVPRFLPGTYTEGGAVAADYDERARVLWDERLQAVGWNSWQAAVDWAMEHDKTWTDIAAKLDIAHQQAREVGMAHGVVLPPLWQRMVVVAQDHVDQHGTLLNTTGRLSSWLAKTRRESQVENLPRRAAAALDRLDPDWRLDREARREAVRRRKVAGAHQVSAFGKFEAQVREAGFDGVIGLLRHGIVEHLGTSELGDLVGVRGDSLLKRMTAGNPGNPFDATEGLCRSVFGMLDDDGSRVQCHECGLWFGVLYHHLSWHAGDDGGPLTADAYRERHGLPADLPLRSDGATGEAMFSRWDERLQEAGFASWDDALAAMAQDHLDLSDLGERLGVRGGALPAVLAMVVPDPWVATEPFRLSVHGYVEDDGERSQCHECGLWYRRLGKHVQAHAGDDGEPLTYAAYRTRHGLEEDYVRPPRRGPSELWVQRLSEAGFGSWEEVLADLARSHRNLRDFADQIGVKDFSVTTELSRVRPDDTWAATEPFRLSTFGHMEDDGERVQCHECGLWFAMLMRGHIGVHVDDEGCALTAEAYRTRHGLPADAALRSVPRGAPDVTDEWRPSLVQLGYSSWDEALVGLAQSHRNLKDLAVECGRKETAAESLFRDRPASVWDATRPFRLSTRGHLEDDGARTQCHECGLWFEHLDRHVTSHEDDGAALTADVYRAKHGLPAGFTLRTVPREGGDPDNLWVRRLRDAGFATWEEALIDLAKKHRNLKDLGDRMGVAVNTVTNALLRSRPVDTWAPTEPYRLGQYGHIEDDGVRSQCHECGLWFERLGRHTKVHLDTDGTPLTWERYQERHGVQRGSHWSREKERRAKKV